MARLFCAVAQGQIKPKVASTLGYLAQTMLQSVPIARHEYLNAFSTDTWRSAVRFSFKYDDPDDADDTADTRAPQPAPQPPASASAPPTPVEAGLQPGSSASSSSTSSPAPQPSAQPAPSPHTPLPPTSTEFAQQLLAGRNSSRSEIPTQSGTGRETGGSPGFSSSPARSSDSAPARTSSTQPAPSSPCTLPTQPAPTPPAPQSTSPQESQPTQNSQNNSLPAPAPPALPPVPPGFGAPANWDVLIPPKPRRRFSRLWQSRE
jgi:hypothetical protein